MSSNYRKQLETERDELSELLQHAKPGDRRVSDVRRLRNIIEELNAMDAGESWTQVEGDTKAKIVLRDLQAGSKVIRS